MAAGNALRIEKVGREAFPETEKLSSGNAHDTVETAIDDTKSRWFGEDHTLTEADLIVRDCNSGRLRGSDSIESSSPVTTKMKVFA